MQIHELPSGTLSNSDVTAIDNGTSTRKYSIGTAINTLNSKLAYSSIRGSGVLTLNSAYSSSAIDSFVIIKIGRIAHITGVIGSMSLSVGRNTIGTIAEAYRPHVYDVFTVGTIGTTSQINTIVRIEITASGELTIVTDSAITSSLRFGCTYITVE